MRKRFNMNKSFSSPHCAAIWMILKGSGYCCSPCQKYWEGKRRKVSLTRFFHLPLPSVPEILRCVECTGHEELFLEPHTVVLRALREQFWRDTADKHGGECSMTPARQLTGRMSTGSQAKVWVLEPGASITGLLQLKSGCGEEERIRLLLGIRTKCFRSILFTCWQDPAWLH